MFKKLNLVALFTAFLFSSNTNAMEAVLEKLEWAAPKQNKLSLRVAQQAFALSKDAQDISQFIRLNSAMSHGLAGAALCTGAVYIFTQNSVFPSLDS